MTQFDQSPSILFIPTPDFSPLSKLLSRWNCLQCISVLLFISCIVIAIGNVHGSGQRSHFYIGEAPLELGMVIFNSLFPVEIGRGGGVDFVFGMDPLEILAFAENPSQGDISGDSRLSDGLIIN